MPILPTKDTHPARLSILTNGNNSQIKTWFYRKFGD